MEDEVSGKWDALIADMEKISAVMAAVEGRK